MANIWHRVLVGATMLSALAGCLASSHEQSKFWPAQIASNSLPDNVVRFQVALIERDDGDPYINHELWKQVDTFILDLERKAILEDNGLRVGQLVGSPPAGFQTLLLSQRYNCNPEVYQNATGRTRSLKLSPVLEHDRFATKIATETKEHQFDRVRYWFDVETHLLERGKLKFVFTPKVETGETAMPFESGPDGKWSLRIDRPHRKFPELSFETTLAPDQYLILGGRQDQAGTLGMKMFAAVDSRVKQRLLVIRNSTPAGAEELESFVEQDAKPSKMPPLALQAGSSWFRGKSK